MARIRSIKPDFFTSETVASLPISARLTFVGLWTHVDDNGVALDNERLIAAALWPLEDDPLEALRRLSGDLQKIATAGLIRRYEHSGRHYLFITGWDEHQKISHPSKPRYPRPPADLSPTPTSKNGSTPPSSGKPPEDLGSPPETLRPEQGAGSRERSREQGAGIPVTAVGGLMDRNACTREAPSAQPGNFFARSVITSIHRYRDAPGWAKKQHLVPMASAALDAGFSREAITRYAGMVTLEGRFLDRQHIPEFREVLRRLSRDTAQDNLCRACADPACSCPAPPAPDRPWTVDDAAELERALDYLGVTPDDLDTTGTP